MPSEFVSVCRGIMPGLPGFTSHRGDLHLGPGFQQWKLLAVQPSNCDSVVNNASNSGCVGT